MTCLYCGCLCLDPHDYEPTKDELCKACGGLKSDECVCRKCDVCKNLLKRDELADDVCGDCLRFGTTIN